MSNFTILEPMSTGDVIDRAVRLYRRNFTALVAIVAVPCFIQYITSMIVGYGYSLLLTESTDTPQFDAGAMAMLGVGIIGYPIWLFAFLMAVCGLSRIVGDHIMMGEPITFRRCIAAARGRVGDIVLMALLCIAIFFVIYLALTVIVVAIMLIVAVIAAMTAALHLPQWAVVTAIVISVILAIAAGVLAATAVLARVIFLPQVMMIEGQSAGSALGRAMRLGAGNWYRVGAIFLFTYFVSLSLFAALTLPTMALLYLAGVLTAEFMVSPAWTVIYSSFNEVSGLLVLPISIVSFTLLYFDSRVRKEAYDLELLARDVAPGFYWQPGAQPAAFGPYAPGVSAGSRAYVQTSPLGLAGYGSPRQPHVQPSPAPTTPVTGRDDLREKFSQDPGSISEPGDAGSIEDSASAPPTLPLKDTSRWPVNDTMAVAQVGTQPLACRACGTAIQAGARFCIRCGSPVE